MRQVAFARFRFHHRAIAIDHEEVAGKLVGNGAREIESPPGHQHNFNSARSRLGKSRAQFSSDTRDPTSTSVPSISMAISLTGIVPFYLYWSCRVAFAVAYVAPLF